jgi:hypothetical protein
MAAFFPYASESHPVWSPLAEAIHKAVWGRVGLAVVQRFVRLWADDRDEAGRRRDRAETAERNRIRAEVVDHWAESLGLPKVDCYGLLPEALELLVQPRAEQPLPPDHRATPLSPVAKWAGLAAIHDVYWKDEKINPWPEPAGAVPPWTLSPDDERYSEVQEAWETLSAAIDEAWPYKTLLDRVSRLGNDDAPVITAWLRELTRTEPPSERVRASATDAGAEAGQGDKPMDGVSNRDATAAIPAATSTVGEFAEWFEETEVSKDYSKGVANDKADKPAAGPQDGGPWSVADSPTRWAKLFKISPKTFKRRVKDGKIRAKRLSDRLYQVHLGDLPKQEKAHESGHR